VIKLKHLITESDSIKIDDKDIPGTIVRNVNNSKDIWTYFISDDGVYYAQKNGGSWKNLKLSLSTSNYKKAKRLIDIWKTGKSDNTPSSDNISHNDDIDTPDVNKSNTIIFPDGSKYIGQVVDGKANGKGTLIMRPGEEYSNKYIGNFKDNELIGKATCIAMNGHKYVGEFTKLANGEYLLSKGIQITPEGDKFIGEFDDMLNMDKGIRIWANGTKYTGQFGKYGNPSGKGTLVWPDGDKYVGEFGSDGWMTGKGTLFWKTGDKFYGKFDHARVTTGTYVSPNGYKINNLKFPNMPDNPNKGSFIHDKEFDPYGYTWDELKNIQTGIELSADYDKYIKKNKK
jgi:hypothetical protein